MPVICANSMTTPRASPTACASTIMARRTRLALSSFRLRCGRIGAKRRPMTDRLVIALAQLNPTVGAIAANLAKARQAHKEAKDKDADLVLYSELYICGYPPEDLVL